MDKARFEELARRLKELREANMELQHKVRRCANLAGMDRIRLGIYENNRQMDAISQELMKVAAQMFNRA